jgi:F-type H+-transporting ATPase subunit a
MTIDPIHQFEISNIFKIGHYAITNSSAYILVSVAAICSLMIGLIAGRKLVSDRFH